MTVILRVPVAAALRLGKDARREVGLIVRTAGRCARGILHRETRAPLDAARPERVVRPGRDDLEGVRLPEHWRRNVPPSLRLDVRAAQAEVGAVALGITVVGLPGGV